MTASDVNSIGTFPGNFSTECTKSMELPHGVAPWALRMVEQFTLGDYVGNTPGFFLQNDHKKIQFCGIQSVDIILAPS